MSPPVCVLFLFSFSLFFCGENPLRWFLNKNQKHRNHVGDFPRRVFHVRWSPSRREATASVRMSAVPHRWLRARLGVEFDLCHIHLPTSPEGSGGSFICYTIGSFVQVLFRCLDVVVFPRFENLSCYCIDTSFCFFESFSCSVMNTFVAFVFEAIIANNPEQNQLQVLVAAVCLYTTCLSCFVHFGYCLRSLQVFFS